MMNLKINTKWHEKNPMPKNPTKEQKIQWHLKHLRHCGCSEIPEKLKEEMIKRYLEVAEG